jgi:peptidoglycan hydrolase-like protein with peptidoglycan-binding domain
MRAGSRTADYDDDDEGASRLGACVRWMRERPLDTMAGTIAAAGMIAILVNALFMQTGPHPAPIFAHKPPQPVAAPALASAPAQRQESNAVPGRPRSEVMAEIQRELTKRGFYDGTADGFYGPKTDAAIRDFEQAAGLRPSAEPNDVLLQTITRSKVKAKPVTPPSDPIAALLGPSSRVMAVQRVLADFGYGQIKPTGIYGPETRAAIERFERERKLPISGQISDRLVRDLGAMTGRPLE